MRVDREFPTMRTISTRQVYSNSWMRVREDTIASPDGTIDQYGVVERSDFVVILALQGNCLLVVEQYRYPIGQWTIELPQGACESGETNLQAARRELLEETGFPGHNFTEIGNIYECASFATHSGSIVTTVLEDNAMLYPLDSEGSITARLVPYDELSQMAVLGMIHDSASLAALFLWNAFARVRGQSRDNKIWQRDSQI